MKYTKKIKLGYLKMSVAQGNRVKEMTGSRK